MRDAGMAEELADVDERDVVARAKAGCPAARADLVQRHQESVFAFVYRYVGQIADAEDLCQEVFLIAFQSLNGFRSESRLRTWLLAIASNRARNWLRREHRRREIGSEHRDRQSDEDVTADGDASAEAVAKTESAAIVRRAIGSLPAREKEAILLRTYHQLSYQEIGNTVGCSIPTVRNLLYRARRQLAAKLGPLMD